MSSETLWLPKTVANLLTTELANLGDETPCFDSADYDNATNKYQFASFFFFGTFDAACDAGALIELHLMYKMDGTHYGDNEDGDMGVPLPSGNSLHGIFHISEQADVYQQLLDVPLLPFAFRAGIRMYTGQDLTDVETHWLKMYPHNHEGQ